MCVYVCMFVYDEVHVRLVMMIPCSDFWEGGKERKENTYYVDGR